MYQLIIKGDEKIFVLNKKVDYSSHDLDELIIDDWSRAHINSRAIVYKDVVYQVAFDHFVQENMATQKLFNWY